MSTSPAGQSTPRRSRNGGRKPKLSLEARMSVRREFKNRPIHEGKAAVLVRLAKLHKVSTVTIRLTVFG